MHSSNACCRPSGPQESSIQLRLKQKRDEKRKLVNSIKRPNISSTFITQLNVEKRKKVSDRPGAVYNKHIAALTKKRTQLLQQELQFQRDNNDKLLKFDRLREKQRQAYHKDLKLIYKN